MKIIVAMAGRGSRFLSKADNNPEYLKPKPLIMVKGMPMMWWAVLSLPWIDLPTRKALVQPQISAADLIFIVLKEHEEKFQISRVIKNVFSEACQIIILNDVTKGAAETVLSADTLLNVDEDIVILDCDNIFNGLPLHQAIQEKSSDTVAIMPVFKQPTLEAKYSNTLFDEKGVAIKVAEKDPQLVAKGAYANLGAYYFSKWSIFQCEATAMINAQDLSGQAGKKEYYIAPLYQKLIDTRQKVKVAVIDQVGSVGTPEDLESYLLTPNITT